MVKDWTGPKWPRRKTQKTGFWQKNTEKDLLSISDGPFEVFWI